MEPGTLVRLIADPGRVGVVMNRTRERAGMTYHQVRFTNSTDFVLRSQLEKVPEEPEDPFELLRQGQLGRARDLRGNLTDIRLTGRLANLIYSMETTNTDFYGYQFKPVLQFLDSPSYGLLIADEVGLGKTIEAGLIWTELRSRFETRRLMVVCPAMLQEKWRMELLNRFGIRGEIIGAAAVHQRLQEYRQGSVFEYALICSMQGMRPRRGWDGVPPLEDPASRLAAFLAESAVEEPLLDLLIIDEAHYLRNPQSMTSRLGHLLRAVSEYIVLLSATPVHLRSQDLFELLNLVDPDTFSHVHSFDEILEANAPLIQARDGLRSPDADVQSLLSLLHTAERHPLLDGNRQLRAILENPPTADELKNHDFRSQLANRIENMNLLGKAVTRTRKRDVTEFKVIREAIAEMVPLSEEERGFYSRVTELVRRYALECEGHEAFLMVMPQRQMSSSMCAALMEWQERQGPSEMSAEILYEDFGAENTETTLGPLVSQIVEEAHRLGDVQTLIRNDAKYSRLKEILVQFLNRHKKEKVILFAYFRRTLRYLESRLKQDGIPCLTLMGGGHYDKQEIIERFRDPGGPRVLLSSEVASEGLDLQFCRVIINYDLPWNPMKVEQRIGRLDRIGQKAPIITIWNLFYENTIDARIYTRLYERLDIFRRALGELEPILGDHIRRLTLELLRGEITPEQEEERIEQTAQALANLRLQEEELESQAASLVAHGDYILRQVRAAQEMERSITAEDLGTYTFDFFSKNYQGCEFRQLSPDRLEFDVRLTEAAKVDLERFLRQNHLTGKTRLASTGHAPVRCIFQNRVGSGPSRGVEVISQFHPLVRFVARRIQVLQISYYPVVSLELSRLEVAGFPPGTYVFTADRWSLQGVRDIERLVFLASPLEVNHSFISEDDSERLVTSAARRGTDWLSASNLVDMDMAVKIAEACNSELQSRYDKYVQQVRNENLDRADLQEKTVIRHRDRQLENLETIKHRHRARGLDSLVRATEGRIAALRARMERRILEIRKGRELRHHRQEVCLGLVKVF